MASITEQTRAFVRESLADVDGSHDFNHIARVYEMALRLAREEGLDSAQMEVVGLGALLHDIADWKYTGDEASGGKVASEFLRSQGYDEAKTQTVRAIVDGVSFHAELGGEVKMFPALAVVQDADRLDAIGAIGIARTFTFGGAKKRAFYDENSPGEHRDGLAQLRTKADYMAGAKGKGGATIDHFYEKLLLLKDLMKTKAGRARAQERHDFMVQFLEQFFGECKAER